MTNEEAIKGLKSLVEVRRKYCAMQTMKDEIEALDMAIKALEKEPCEDAISRQAVLEGLRTCYDTETKEYSDGSQWINYEDAVAEMENLPPVTPQQSMGWWINIDATHSKCDKCGAVFEIASENGEANYCPNCGQPKMQEVEG